MGNRSNWMALAGATAIASAFAACGGETQGLPGGPGADGGAQPDGGEGGLPPGDDGSPRGDDGGGPTVGPVVVHSESVTKVDLLFVIDNSASMGDKHALLAA